MQENEKWSRFLFKTNSIAQETLVLSIGPIGAMLFQNCGRLSGTWYGLDVNFLNSSKGFQLSAVPFIVVVLLGSSFSHLITCSRKYGVYIFTHQELGRHG